MLSQAVEGAEGDGQRVATGAGALAHAVNANKPMLSQTARPPTNNPAMTNADYPFRVSIK
ncbi:hypothetical protein U91I_02062 [alpha proteobacterium U9-1i]|nr:hypothetical protein U91I_02062 [alpha proteobacterium U9-1i]